MVGVALLRRDRARLSGHGQHDDPPALINREPPLCCSAVCGSDARGGQAWAAWQQAGAARPKTRAQQAAAETEPQADRRAPMPKLVALALRWAGGALALARHHHAEGRSACRATLAEVARL